MKKPVNNVHDKYFKKVISDRQFAIDFFRFFLPEKIISKLDFSSLRPISKTFINNALVEHFADSLHEVKFVGSEERCTISILLEHKSYPDSDLPFQILHYLSSAYLLQSKNVKDEKKKDKIVNFILPVIFYHGEAKWRFDELKDVISIPAPEFVEYVPTHEAIFINLNNIADERLIAIRNTFLRSALMIQKYKADPKALMERFKLIFEFIRSSGNWNLGQSTMVYYLDLVEINPEKFIILVEELPKKNNSKMVSTLEQFIEKGRNEGIEVGIEKGIEKGIELGQAKGMELGQAKGMELGQEKGAAKAEEKVIRHMNASRFSPGKIADLTGISLIRILEVINKSE